MDRGGVGEALAVAQVFDDLLRILQERHNVYLFGGGEVAGVHVEIHLALQGVNKGLTHRNQNNDVGLDDKKD